jgi:hypothetical protein
MSKKKFSLKTYLEPIDLEDIEQEEELDSLFPDESVSEAYPFTKEALIKYLGTEEFLASLPDKTEIKKIEKTDEKIALKQIIENLPLEKKQQEIQLEKRRRNQAYKMLDYTLSNNTYFDFFSADAFQIAKNSKYMTQLYGKQKVSLELLFLSFFDLEFQVGSLLQSFGFDETFLEKLMAPLKMSKKKENGLWPPLTLLTTLQKKGKNLLESVFSLGEDETHFNQQIRYSYQVHQIFEKSAENALNRFKTPVITPEILLITLMEEKESLIGKLIKKNITDETNWYLLRYKLLKRLYAQESNVRSQVKRNQHFFAYLLKTQLPDVSFEKLIENKVLGKAVSLFRNVLIHDLLKSNLADSLDAEIHASLMIGPKRYYST